MIDRWKEFLRTAGGALALLVLQSLLYWMIAIYQGGEAVPWPISAFELGAIRKISRILEDVESLLVPDRVAPWKQPYGHSPLYPARRFPRCPGGRYAGTPRRLDGRATWRPGTRSITSI